MNHPLTNHALPERLPAWGVLVLESHHGPEFMMEWRTHDFFKIVYVLSGAGKFLFDSSEIEFSGGDVILVAPSTPNRIEDDPSSASSLYVCCVASSLLDFDPRLSRGLRSRAFCRDGHFANRVASLLRRMVHTQETETPSRPVAMVSDALKLIHAVCERSQRTKKTDRETDDRAVIQRYVDALPNQFFDETTIDAAASQLGVSRRTFTKLFTEITGETWLEHIRRLAIEHAQRRLRQTDLPITSVAFECGFNDLSTFYRQFKKQCGVAPGQYRQREDS